MTKRETAPPFWAIKSFAYITLPKDLDIFSLLKLINALCIQYLAILLPFIASAWAISFSWCGNLRSYPPPWISIICLLKIVSIITQHSVCHPGLPSPQGVFHLIPLSVFFQSAKSSGDSFFEFSSTLAPAIKSSTIMPLKAP